jgi:hypothetical protein
MANRDSQNIFSGYISKIYVDAKTTNDDVVTVTTKKFSLSNEIFELDRRVISPSVLLTEKNLEELQPEVSDVYPFAVVPREDSTGKTIIYSPTVENEVTASQNYYTSVYFERYDLDVLREINREFEELESGTPEIVLE